MFQDNVLSSEAKSHFHEVYGKMADAVHECLQSYLWVVGEVHKTFAAKSNPSYFVPGMLLMEYAEPIDGVSILARTGSAKNCIPVIRSGFELQMNLLYMLEKDGTLDERSLAYEFFYFMKQLKNAQKCDPTSEAGKQVRGQIKGDPLADIFDHPGRDIPKEIAVHQRAVDAPRFALAKADYEKSKPKHWYGMWGGPNGLESLAHEIKFHARYEAMYRYWSGHAHGEAALKRLMEKGGQPQMDPVRSPKGLPMTCLHACSLANEMAGYLKQRFVPHLQAEMTQRYLTRIKPGLMYISSVRGLEG